MIALKKKGGRHVWEGLDNYMPIILLNTELKILAQILENSFQIVTGDLIGTKQNNAVKGRSIQNNLHLVCEILEGIEVTLINLYLSKELDRVDHWFSTAVLEIAGFKSEFR